MLRCLSIFRIFFLNFPWFLTWFISQKRELGSILSNKLQQKWCRKVLLAPYSTLLAWLLHSKFSWSSRSAATVEKSHVKWGARSLCSTFVVHHWCNSRFMVTKWPLPWFYGGWSSDKKGIFLVWETSRFANWPVKSRYGRFATPETR